MDLSVDARPHLCLPYHSTYFVEWIIPEALSIYHEEMIPTWNFLQYVGQKVVKMSRLDSSFVADWILMGRDLVRYVSDTWAKDFAELSRKKMDVIGQKLESVAKRLVIVVNLYSRADQCFCILVANIKALFTAEFGRNTVLVIKRRRRIAVQGVEIARLRSRIEEAERNAPNDGGVSTSLRKPLEDGAIDQAAGETSAQVTYNDIQHMEMERVAKSET
jgi:hypothetical protein